MLETLSSDREVAKFWRAPERREPCAKVSSMIS